MSQVQQHADMQCHTDEGRMEKLEVTEVDNTVMVKNLEDITPGIPEFKELRILVSNATYFVDNLEKCGDIFWDIISEIRKHLKKAQVLVNTLEIAQKETVLKLLGIKCSNASAQVYTTDLEFCRSEQSSQTTSIAELLILLIARKKMTPKAEYNVLPITSLSSVQVSETRDSKNTLSIVEEKEEKDEKDDDEISSVGENSTRYARRKSSPKGGKNPNIACLEPPPVEPFLEAKIKRDRRYVIFLLLLLTGSIAINTFLILALTDALQRKEHVLTLRDEIRAEVENTMITCPSISQPANGKVECSQKPNVKLSNRANFGSVCSFSCDFEYELTGSKHMRCTGENKWNTSLPECQKRLCHEVQGRDCAGLRKLGKAFKSGIYQVKQCGTFKMLEVYCDFSTQGGGWTAIQRRKNDHADFSKLFHDFEESFGKPDGSFWIGLKNMNFLSSTEPQSLMVVMTDWFYPEYHRSKAYAMYNRFLVENASVSYRLHVRVFKPISPESINAGDSLSYSNGMQFTTKDSDKDFNKLRNCAEITGAAWWHRNCTHANLNAEYTSDRIYGEKTIYWKTWRSLSSLKSAEMFIRPQSLNHDPYR
ncbi:uncharacterized protein LOC143446552 isoform X2 [Clavelina lepadiformis]|uniref:uncharacterized protein LOC143446552 isoform X2 n=1 Tax=Clavelina lepadiformis TaxID=159417 RepID=UPI004042E7B6